MTRETLIERERQGEEVISVLREYLFTNQETRDDRVIEEILATLQYFCSRNPRFAQ